MPSISLDCEPASAHSTRTSPAPPCSRGHSSPQPSAAAALSVVSHPATQPQRFAVYNQAPSSGFLSTPLEQYRLQLYNYAVHMERLRCPQYTAGGQQLLPSAAAAVAAFGYSNVAAAAAAAAAVGGGSGNSPYAPGSRLALSMSLFPQRIFQPEEPKPQHSYIGLIAMAILSSVETKLVLSDIYQYILDNYPYFRTRGPGWRNSIRHNLSLNDCFVKSGRSANGKGHYWAIHPANMDDFRKGDFRRRKAQRKVRKHMGLSVDDEGTDSPSPPPLAVTPPPSHHLPLYNHHLSPTHTHLGYLQQHHQQQQQQHHQHSHHAPPFHQHHQHYGQSFVAAAAAAAAAAAVASATPTSTHYISSADVSLQAPHNACNNQLSIIKETTTTTASVIANLYSQTRKRQFDVASLLAPDVEVDVVDDSETIERATGGAAATTTTTTTMKRTLIAKLSVQQHHHHHHHHMTPYASKQHSHAQLTTQQQLQQNLSELDEQEDIDVVASDVEDEIEGDADELDEVVDELEEEEKEGHMRLPDNRHDNEDNNEPEQNQEENNNSKTESRNLTPEAQSQDSVRQIEELQHQKPQQLYQENQQQQQQSNVLKAGVSDSQEPTKDSGYHNISPSSHSNSNQQHPAAPQKQQQQQQQQQQNLQRLMHQLPNELSHVDPRIFGCYYGTYMAAAAAQQVVARRINSSISFPLPATTTPTATPTNKPAQQHLQHQQQQQQMQHNHHQQQHHRHTQQLQQLQLPQQ